MPAKSEMTTGIEISGARDSVQKARTATIIEPAGTPPGAVPDRNAGRRPAGQARTVAPAGEAQPFRGASSRPALQAAVRGDGPAEGSTQKAGVSDGRRPERATGGRAGGLPGENVHSVAEHGDDGDPYRPARVRLLELLGDAAVDSDRFRGVVARANEMREQARAEAAGGKQLKGVYTTGSSEFIDGIEAAETALGAYLIVAPEVPENIDSSTGNAALDMRIAALDLLIGDLGQEKQRRIVNEKVKTAYEASLAKEEPKDNGGQTFSEYLAGFADEDIIDWFPEYDSVTVSSDQVLAEDMKELRLILESVNAMPALSEHNRPQEDIEKRLLHEQELGEYAKVIGFSRVRWIFTMKEDGPHGQYGVVECVATEPSRPLTKLEYAAHIAAPGDGTNDPIVNLSPGDIKQLENMGYGGSRDGGTVSAIEDLGDRIVEHNRQNSDKLLPLPRSYSRYDEFEATTLGEVYGPVPGLKERSQEGGETISEELAIVQSWLETEVIAKGTCPPPVGLVKDFRDTESGKVDWESVGDKIKIVSYRHHSPTSPELIDEVAEDYRRFIEGTYSEDEATPLSILNIFPDFASVAESDRFIESMMNEVSRKVIDSDKGLEIVLALAVSFNNANPEKFPIPEGSFTTEQGLMDLSLQVINKAFSPLRFYGQNLKEQDLDRFVDENGEYEKGDPHREQVLGRAPYYLLQVLDPFEGPELVRHLTPARRARLHARNSRLAAQQDPGEYGERMDEMRTSTEHADEMPIDREGTAERTFPGFTFRELGEEDPRREIPYTPSGARRVDEILEPLVIRDGDGIRFDFESDIPEAEVETWTEEEIKMELQKIIEKIDEKLGAPVLSSKKIEIQFVTKEEFRQINEEQKEWLLKRYGEYALDGTTGDCTHNSDGSYTIRLAYAGEEQTEEKQTVLWIGLHEIGHTLEFLDDAVFNELLPDAFAHFGMKVQGQADPLSLEIPSGLDGDRVHEVAIDRLKQLLDAGITENELIAHLTGEKFGDAMPNDYLNH